MTKNFKRGDLLLRRWNRLKHQVVWLGQSTVEINRDSAYIIVRDQSITVREALTEEELIKWCTPQVMEHLHKKHSREGDIQFQHRDALFAAAQSATVDYSKNRRPERGIKIQVGQHNTE